MEEQNLIFDIYNEDGTSFHGLSLKKATFSTEMMSLSDNITGDVYYPDNNLTFSFKEYITYKGVNYYLLLSAPPTIVKKGMTEENGDLKGMTKYSFTFYHPMAFLFNIPFTDIAVSNDEKKYKSENTTFYWIGTISELVTKINKNLQGTTWTCKLQNGFVDEGTMSEVIQFQNQSIADVLKTGYETYHVPYVIDGYDILFGVPSNEILDETTNAPYVFKMGQGLGLRNNDRTPKNNAIITRIAGYGNTENIPFGYPKIKWTGNQAWDYTINNDGANPESFPIIDGIINGENVRLIKHPFTRTELMPTIYVESVNKKVNPLALGYDPNTELIDYYDAKSVTYWQSEEPNYVFYTISNAPSIGDNVYNADGTIFGICTTDKRTDYIIVNNLTCNLAGSYEYTNLINVNTPAYQKIAFDGSGDTANIKPTIVGATYNNQRIDLIKNIYWINDNKTPADAIDDTYDSKEGKYAQGYFKIEFYPLGFDLYAMAAVTSAMTVNMTNGACNACKFELAEDWDIVKSNFYYTKEDGTIVFDPNNQYSAHRDFTLFPDSTDISISVIVKKDINTFGTLMPNIYQQPKTGDSFVFTGIDMPDIRITEAQKILDNAMKQTMKEQNIAYYEYPLDFDVYFLTTHQNILNQIKTNCIVRFEYAGETLALSVKNYSISWGDNALPTYKITLTDDISITLNQIGQISEGLSKLGSQITALQSYYGKNILEELANKLSKTENDKAYGLITFLKGLNIGDGTNGIDSNGNATLKQAVLDILKSKDFQQGLLDGTGFGIYKDINGKSSMEVDKLLVRLKMIISMLEIRKLSYVGGDQVFSSAGSHVVKVTTLVSGDYRCYILADDGTTRTMNDWKIGDQAMCRTDNIKAGIYENISNRYYWRLVIATGTEILDGKTYNYVDLSNTYGSLNLIGEDSITYSCVGYDTSVENDIPQAEDDIVQLGNQINTERQYAYIIYVSEHKRVDYFGINDYNLSSHVVELHSASGGFINADRFEIRSSSGTGVSSPIVCDRGTWTTGLICGHYDRVSHNGSLWLCNVGKGMTTTEEPTDTSLIWIKQVDKGANAITYEIYTSSDTITSPDFASAIPSGISVKAYKWEDSVRTELTNATIIEEAYGPDTLDYSITHTGGFNISCNSVIDSGDSYVLLSLKIGGVVVMTRSIPCIYNGVGISGITEYFAVSTSSTVEPTTWVTTLPSMTPTNKYLWNYERILYSDSSTKDTKKRVIGVYGDTGIGISSIVTYYLATSASSGVTISTSGWTTTIQSITSTNKYLWNYEKITYTDNNIANTTPIIIGTYGEKGDKGDTGLQGDKGADAEIWVLSPVIETALVDKNNLLTATLSYRIYYVKGNTRTLINATSNGFFVKYRGNNGLPASTIMSMGDNPNAVYTISNFNTTANRPQYFVVELWNGTDIKDIRTVSVALKADSWIEQDSQRLALINQNTDKIAAVELANGAITQRVEDLRNGVRNLISFGDVKTTFGSATGSSAQLWDSDTKLVTLKANTTYTLTACGCPSQGTVDAGGYMPVIVYGGTGNAFMKSVDFTSSTKEIKSVTFSTSDSSFPSDGVLTFNAYRSGGTGGSTQTCYLDWIVITEGSVPASDYFSDVETRLANGQFIIDANTIIKQMLFAIKALIGGAVFFDRFMYSKYGTGSSASNPETDYMLFDSSNPFNSTTWKANMVIDFLNGIFMASKGNVMFNQDGSGYLAGTNISWDATGSLSIKGKVIANLFYGKTLGIFAASTSQSGGYWDIDPDGHPSSTIIIETGLSEVARLPLSYNYDGLELTIMFKPTSSNNGAKLTRLNTSDYIGFFRDTSGTGTPSGGMYTWGDFLAFESLEGVGWIKLHAVKINSSSGYWLIMGHGGVLKCMSGSQTYWLRNGALVI